LVIAFLGVFIIYVGPIITELTSPTVRASLKNVLSHLQFLSINLNLGLHWPPAFDKLFDNLRRLMDGVQLAAPECVSAGYTYDLYVTIVLYSFIAVAALFITSVYMLNTLRKTIRIHGITAFPGIDTSPLKNRLLKLRIPLGWWVQRSGLWAKVSTTLHLTSGMLYPVYFLQKHAARLRQQYRLPPLPEGKDEDIASLAELALQRAYELYVMWWRTSIGLKQFSVLLVGLAYTYLLTVTTLDLDCFTDARGVARLVRDSRVLCDTAEHRRSSSLSTAIVVIVGIGVPVIFIAMVSRLRMLTRQREPLVSSRHEEDEDTDAAKETLLDLLEWRGLRDPETLVSWGGMYEAYQNECVDPFTLVEALCELRSAASRQGGGRASWRISNLFHLAGRSSAESSTDVPQVVTRTATGFDSLYLHWYSMWLIGYHGERNATPIVKELATKLVAWKQGDAPPPDVDSIPLPKICHPVFDSWWARLKLWFIVTRYIIRVRLSCYYEAVQFIQKAFIVLLGTSSRIGVKVQAASMAAVYGVFAFISFWVSPYRPVEVRLPVPYTLLRLLLFPFFLQVPGWMLSEESRRKADADTDPEWKRKPEGSWFPYCEYYRETICFSNALNIADVTGKLVLGGTIIASSFPSSGSAAAGLDVVLVALNMFQVFYGIAPIVVRLVGFAASDFPPAPTRLDDGSEKEVEVTIMFCGLKTVASNSPLLEYPTLLGKIRGRTAVLLNMAARPEPTYEDCMQYIKIHSEDVGLIKGREAWTMVRREHYRHSFETTVKKVLAELEVRKMLIESAIKAATRNLNADKAAGAGVPPVGQPRSTSLVREAHEAELQEQEPEPSPESSPTETTLTPPVTDAATQVAELQDELHKVAKQLDSLVSAFGATRLGELKDGSTTEWSVFCKAVDSVTGARRSRSEADPNPHLSAVGSGILLLAVIAIGLALSHRNPNFFAKAPPPPSSGVLYPPPPRRTTPSG